jgi:hypothetical protein
MPIDARIALAGTPQAYDAFGAYRTARNDQQAYRQNQMAMQAAQDVTQRAAGAREAARSVNFMDPAAGASFLSAHGADVAEPYLAAGARAAGTDVAQATGQRAQVAQDREGRDRIRAAWGRGLVSALADSSDTGLVGLRARLIADGVPETDVDATLAQIGGMDAAARPEFIRNLAATDKDARDAMKLVAADPRQINRGGTIVTVDMNPYSATYNQEVRTDLVSASPNRPVFVQTADGIYSATPGGGPAAPVTDAEGNTLQPYVAPRAGTPATDALGGQAASAETLRDVLGQLDANFQVLYKNGFMRGEGVSPAGNVAQWAGDRIPGVRGARLAANTEADTAAGNVEALLSTAISTLSALYGTSSRVMDAVKEMENARTTFGSQNMTIEAARNMVATALRRVDELEAARANAGGGAPAATAPAGGNRAALEAEARRRGLIP